MVAGMIRTLLAALLLSAPTLSASLMAATESFTVISQGARIGTLKADTSRGAVIVAYDVKSNGRGPTINEALTLGPGGRPASWRVTGATTFGSKVDETLSARGRGLAWTDSTGQGSSKTGGIYVSQFASPYALGVYARALLASGNSAPALPGGTLALVRGETITLNGAPGPLKATVHTLTGIDSEPANILLDDAGALVAVLGTRSSFVRAGYEGEDKRLRDLASRLSAERLARLQRELAHDYRAPVRIANVRLFDPAAKALTAPVSVVVHGRTIASVQPADAPATPGEVRIDGAGGTLVPGMFEMHGHLGESGALPNLIAGITTVRDMGNNNPVLDTLVERIEKGEIAGPRVIRSGLIEGKSQFANLGSGILASSQAEALDAVRWYAARGYHQIKSYNSINPAWVPAMVAEAKRLGMRVSGHVPAFATADQMMAAGFDEITHINQFALGWVIKPEEDTRTLFRLTALRRLKDLDLDSPRVRATMDAMAAKKIALDPTLGIHEWLFLSRDGQVPPGSVDYIDHLPIADQRELKSAKISLAEPGDAEAYTAAMGKLLDIVRRLHARGVMIVPGTDTGGAMTFHRELELMTEAGMTPADVLARATLDMARYTGRDQSLGSIERGKLADFFLVPGDPTQDLRAIKRIAMVVKDGVFYYPAEAYPKLGIKPFADAPEVTRPAATTAGPVQGEGEAHGHGHLH